MDLRHPHGLLAFVAHTARMYAILRSLASLGMVFSFPRPQASTPFIDHVGHQPCPACLM